MFSVKINSSSGPSNIILDNQIQTKEDKIKDLKKNDKILQTNLNDIKENKGTELVKYKSKSSFTIEKNTISSRSRLLKDCNSERNEAGESV